LLSIQAGAAAEYLYMADKILGFKISDLMCHGTAQQLKETRVTQPAMFLYAVVKARISRDFRPDMVAGHSLGEFAALSSIRVISLADGLRLVQKRAEAMQKACEAQESGMAAVLGIDDAIIESVCAGITEEIVVPANYNYPGQLVISGTKAGLALAKERLMEAGARRVLPLRVHGAFHSPVMESAKAELETAIRNTTFRAPSIPVYQNVTGRPSQDPEEIQENLVKHLTSPVRWTETIENMVMDGARQFIEIGPRTILSNMIKKIDRRYTPVSL
jgi:[acyl-carrier-protein] S-malonyltransferase